MRTWLAMPNFVNKNQESCRSCLDYQDELRGIKITQ